MDDISCKGANHVLVMENMETIDAENTLYARSIAPTTYDKINNVLNAQLDWDKNNNSIQWNMRLKDLIKRIYYDTEDIQTQQRDGESNQAGIGTKRKRDEDIGASKSRKARAANAQVMPNGELRKNTAKPPSLEIRQADKEFFMCEDKQAAGGECAQWYGDHVFKIFASNLDYTGKEVKMLQDTWSYVQMKLFCDGMTTYVEPICGDLKFKDKDGFYRHIDRVNSPNFCEAVKVYDHVERYLGKPKIGEENELNDGRGLRIHTITCRNGWRCTNYTCINVFKKNTAEKIYSNPTPNNSEGIETGWSRNLIYISATTFCLTLNFNML